MHPPLTNWSYSRYKTWLKCPALLKFEMEDPTPKDFGPAADRGSAFHKNIELYLLGEGDLHPELEYYRGFFDGVKEQGALPELKLAMDKNWNPVAWDDENRWWRGVLDCVVPGDNVVTIYDWKTGGEYKDHRDQREIYAAAYFAKQNVPFIRVFHVYLDKKQNSTTLYRAEDIPEIMREWNEKAGVMLSDTAFIPNPGFYCRSCRYRKEVGGPCPF